jgi:hypothetical protein
MTPDNASFYHAAYIAAAVVYGAYAISLVIRSRRARERLRGTESGVARRPGD